MLSNIGQPSDCLAGGIYFELCNGLIREPAARGYRFPTTRWTPDGSTAAGGEDERGGPIARFDLHRHMVEITA